MASGNAPLPVTWEILIDSVSNAASHPNETVWIIYRYLIQHYKTIGSQEARMLLVVYLRLKMRIDPHSCIHLYMLDLAVSISEEYTDFQLVRFLRMWGYGRNLCEEAMCRTVGLYGQSLKRRVDYAVQSYLLRHPENGIHGRSGAVVSMYAVKMFERKQHLLVKLVAANGLELIAGSQLFPCKPAEICGKMYEVLTRVSEHGKLQASEIVEARRRMADAFPTQTGYVDRIDDIRGYIHVYDAKSGHFVANKEYVSADIIVRQGCFVLFCPIIVNGDHFKSAAILGVLDRTEGRKAFGTYVALVLAVNCKDGFLRYVIETAIKPTTEGTVTKEGTVSLLVLSEEDREKIAKGQRVRLLLFLKRCKDGVKRNHVVEMVMESR